MALTNRLPDSQHTCRKQTENCVNCGSIGTLKVSVSDPSVGGRGGERVTIMSSLTLEL